MSSNILPFDLDKNKMVDLLKRYYQRHLTREEALELIPLLEKEWEIAMTKGRTKFAEELSDLLIALNGYAHGSLEVTPIVTRVSG
jgi:hypothetical protein